jgi:hypothetical protein
VPGCLRGRLPSWLSFVLRWASVRPRLSRPPSTSPLVFTASVGTRAIPRYWLSAGWHLRVPSLLPCSASVAVCFAVVLSSALCRHVFTFSCCLMFAFVFGRWMFVFCSVVFWVFCISVLCWLFCVVVGCFCFCSLRSALAEASQKRAWAVDFENMRDVPNGVFLPWKSERPYSTGYSW